MDFCDRRQCDGQYCKDLSPGRTIWYTREKWKMEQPADYDPPCASAFAAIANPTTQTVCSRLFRSLTRLIPQPSDWMRQPMGKQDGFVCEFVDLLMTS